MTTVAFDGKTLVADSLSVVNGEATVSPKEKIHLPPYVGAWELEGMVVLALACSGDAMAKRIMKKFLEQKLDTLHVSSIPTGTSSFSAIVITEQKKAWKVVYRAKGPEGAGVQVIELGEKGSIGSGRAVADGIMSIGLPAYDAVRGARNIDPFTGGLLRSWSLDDPTVITKEIANSEVTNWG